MKKTKRLLFEDGADGELDDRELWEKEWKDMPEFVQENLKSFRKIVVHFKCQEDVDAFAKLVGQTITPKLPSLWYPKTEVRRYADKRYFDGPDAT